MDSKNSGVAAAAGAAAPWAATPERQHSKTRLAPGWMAVATGLLASAPEHQNSKTRLATGWMAVAAGLMALAPERQNSGSALVRGSNMTCLALALAFPGICLGIAGRGP